MRIRLLPFVVLVIVSSASALAASAAVSEKPQGKAEKIDNPLLEVEPEPEPLMSGQLVVRALSRYVDDNDIAKHGSIQSELTVNVGMFYADLWHSNDDELDYSVGLAYSFWEKKPYQVDLDLGVSYVDISFIGRTAGDILQPYAVLSHTFMVDTKTMKPFIRAEEAIPLDGNASGGSSGFTFYAGFTFGAELTKQLSLEQTVRVAISDGAYGYLPDQVFDYSVSPKWKLNEYVTLDISFRVSSPMDSSRQKENEYVFGGGVTTAF